MELPKHILGFVLLRSPDRNLEDIISKLEDNWGIIPEEPDSNDRVVVFGWKDMQVSLALFPAPVPNREAEMNAGFNYLWCGAADIVSEHTAQIVVSVNGGSDLLERALTFVKVCESCIDGDTVGIYANHIVYEPAFYAAQAQEMKRGELPLIDLVWLGLSRAGGKLSGYTMGLENFGKHEVEILDCRDTPRALLNMMLSVVSYVLTGNVTLNDGETIGFTADQKLKITLSQGVEFDDRETLKIEYPL